MTISLIKRILDLVAEFLTHTDIFRDAFNPARTITPGPLQPFLHGIDNLFVLI